MKTLLTISAVILVAQARPDVGLAYNYKPPSTSFSTPLESNLNPQPYSYPVPSVDFSGSNTQQVEVPSNSYIPQPLQPEINKHVYFFESPEQTIQINQRVRYQPQAPQKNYKIIFVKAPSYVAPAPPVIPLQPQNQEKTLVYVLVKKQDELAPIVIPTAPPTAPAKPEVYFIKYNNQKDAEEQISGTLQGGKLAGVAANNYENKVAFVESIAKEPSASGSQGNLAVVRPTNNDYLPPRA